MWRFHTTSLAALPYHQPVPRVKLNQDDAPYFGLAKRTGIHVTNSPNEGNDTQKCQEDCDHEDAADYPLFLEIIKLR